LFGTIREIDRYLNGGDMAHLYYPNVYILKDGFKEFYARFNQYKEFFLPENGAYVEMKNPQYCQLYKKYHKEV
jgi:hypothetical protein